VSNGGHFFPLYAALNISFQDASGKEIARHTSHVFCPPSGFGHGNESFYDFDIPGGSIWAMADKIVVSATEEKTNRPPPPTWTIIKIPTD
jgi:hypothetical protein